MSDDVSFEYKPGGEVLRDYMKSDKFVRGIRGPVGSGKSVGSIVEIFRRALQQEPNDRGIRRTRWAVIRNTGPQLKTTTIKTWLDWFPEEDWGKFRWGTPFTHHIFKGDIDMEVIFLALDDEKDVRKLLSLELTGIFVNEAREVPKSIIDACTMRVGRFPSMREGGPTWYGVIMDTNAPEDDHWWPIMSGDSPLPDWITKEEALMLQKPDDWEFFNQPSGMLEIKDHEGHVTGYERNANAENAANLTPEYYSKIITGKTKDWIDVYVMNRLGAVVEGKPVYPTYKEETHRAPDPLFNNKDRTLWVGVDFGFYPAAIFAQRFAGGRWNILRELCPNDVSLAVFAREILNALAELDVGVQQDVRIYGDPAGDIRSNQREDTKTSFQVLKMHGVTAIPAPSNDPTLRIETVKTVIDRMVDGSPGLQVSPECRKLNKGFVTGYCYRRIGNTQRYEEKPMKNEYSHPHDALQYLFMGAGEGRKITRPAATAATSRPKKAKTSWNLFKNSRQRRRRKGSI